MAESQRCPNCGRHMPTDAPQGLCPACLLAGVLDPPGVGGSRWGESRPTASLPGGSTTTVDLASALAYDTTLPDDSPQPRPETGPGSTAACDPGDEPGGGEGPIARSDRIRSFGDYEIQGELGGGSMGIVYQARQISLNRYVALKMLKLGALAGDEALRRFENEAKVVARLDHPHIVPIYEVGNQDGNRYFSMKLVPGSSLDRRLSAYANDPAAAAKLMVTIAEAVHHAHQRGILHRDLKPSNILLDERGRPHVSDFGLAKRLESDDGLTVSGAVLGTPAYMAPEQAAGTMRLATTLSDVYGLGAVLYALLTGKAPFEGRTPLETLDRVRQRSAIPPSRLNPKIPRDLDVICLKCLEKNPPRRYPSALALAAELARFLDGEPIRARRSGVFERGWRWFRRSPAIASLKSAVVLLLLAALIAAGLGWLAAIDARRKETHKTEMVEQALYDVRMALVQRYWELGEHAARGAGARRVRSGERARPRSTRVRVVLLAAQVIRAIRRSRSAGAVDARGK